MSGTAIQILFYREFEEYGEFCNFYETKTPIVYEGKKYKTSEHLYQALKFLYSGASKESLDYAEVVRVASTPNKAKILASLRIAGGYTWRTNLNELIQKAKQAGVKLRTDWDEKRVDVMLQVLRTKFRQDAHCRDKLLATGDALLVEHTTRDRFWGDGGTVGLGANHLGKLLMQVRSELRAAVAPPVAIVRQSSQLLKRALPNESSEIVAKRAKI